MKSSPLCSWEKITTHVGFKDNQDWTGMHVLAASNVCLFRCVSVQLRIYKKFAFHKLESGVVIAGCSPFSSLR